MTDIKSLFDLLILQLSKHSPLRLKIKIFKFAFVHLRYFLGGDRPSQTTSHKLSFIKLVKSNFKNGISLLHIKKLPFILHKKNNFTT